MRTYEPQAGLSEVTRAQLWLSTALLGALCFACLTVGLLARFSPVMKDYVASQLDLQQRINGGYIYTGGYADWGDYLLVDQLPDADYNRGGVYFMGASNTVVSIMPWMLDPAEQRLIHNYGLPGVNHREAFHFLRSLVEEQGLLQAGGEKTTVFLGLFYSMAREKRGRVLGDDQIPLLFQRHGFYSFDTQDGIHLVPMASPIRFLRRERVYANRFLRVLATWPNHVAPAHDHEPEYYIRTTKEVMGPQWQEDLDEQLPYLATMLDYLRERGVRVHVVLPPYPTFHDELPFAVEYRKRVLYMLETRRIPITDFSHLLPDDEFVDGTHFRYNGQLQVHNLYRELALRALAAMETPLKP